MIKVTIYTAFALTAFAFNSILCRLALRAGEADAVGFTLVRLASGAVTLIAISYFFGKTSKGARRGNLISGFFLFAYAVCFSLAYVSLSVGVGAVLLFGSVQLSMILFALFRGERPRRLEWLGLALAAGGLIYLFLPGLAAPPIYGSALMVTAGVAWGGYTLRGKGSGEALSATTANFIWTVPMIAILSAASFSKLSISPRGFVLAALSGSVASGIGYTVWYGALKFHTFTRAAILQLSVPIITAAAGVVFLSETATRRLWIAGALILGGIALTIVSKSKR